MAPGHRTEWPTDQGDQHRNRRPGEQQEYHRRHHGHLHVGTAQMDKHVTRVVRDPMPGEGGDRRASERFSAPSSAREPAWALRRRRRNWYSPRIRSTVSSRVHSSAGELLQPGQGRRWPCAAASRSSSWASLSSRRAPPGARISQVVSVPARPGWPGSPPKVTKMIRFRLWERLAGAGSRRASAAASETARACLLQPATPAAPRGWRAGRRWAGRRSSARTR